MEFCRKIKVGNKGNHFSKNEIDVARERAFTFFGRCRRFVVYETPLLIVSISMITLKAPSWKPFERSCGVASHVSTLA